MFVCFQGDPPRPSTPELTVDKYLVLRTKLLAPAEGWWPAAITPLDAYEHQLLSIEI